MALVEDGLAAGLEGRQYSEGVDPYPELCIDSRPDKYYPHYVHHFPASVLGDDPDGFVQRVEEYWASQRVKLEPIGQGPDTSGSYGSTRSGARLRVFVNQRTGMVLVAGSGACALRDEDS